MLHITGIYPKEFSNKIFCNRMLFKGKTSNYKTLKKPQSINFEVKKVLKKYRDS